MSTLRILRERAGMTQAQLGERVGTAQAQIARLERGDRRLTMAWVAKLAPALGMAPADLALDLCAEETAPEAAKRRPPGRPPFPPEARAAPSPPHPTPGAPVFMPVRSAVVDGGREPFPEDGPTDWIERPPYLKNAREPYGLWVVDDSMAPRYRPAQIVHVNPHKPPTPGAGVVVHRKSGAVLLKEYVRRTPEGVLLKEYQPAEREFLVPSADLGAVHTIAGLQEA